MRYDSLADRKTRFVLAAAAVLAATASLARADRAPVFALVGGRVVTVSGAAHENGTVILRDGVIEAVGTGVPVPPDARVLDAKGLVITPGLIDAYGGVGLPGPARPGGSPPATPAPGAGEAGLRPDALALDAVRVADALKARDSGVTTALVIPREGVLPGRSVLLNLSGETAAGMVLRQPAALHLNMTTLRRRYPGSLMGTVALARQALLDAARYRDEWAAYERSPRGRKRPRYDAALQAWTDVLAGRMPLVVGTRSENDVRRALALADEFKVRVVLAGGRKSSRALTVLQARRPTLLLGVNFDPPAPAGFFGPPDEEKTRREIDEAEGEPARLHREGIAFALVSDHAPDLLAGVRKAIERGLPREAALRALTLAPAEALGVADRLGSLEPGKIANVVAWSGEPLTAEARPRMVFVDGELYEPDDKGPARPGRGATADASPAPSPAAAAAASPSPSPSPSPRAASAPEMTPPEPRPLPRTFALTGATILTASPQGTIPRGTIVVRDGKIASVGAGPAPAGLPVVNADGQFVTPGLIDAHSHLAIEGDVNECTDVVTAEVRVSDVIDQRDPDIYRNLAGGVTTINVLHGSCNAIGGQNAVLKLRRGKAPAEMIYAEAPRGIKFALGENPKRSNFNVPGPRRYPRTRMGVEAVLRRAFQDAVEYRREWQEYRRKARAAGSDTPVPPRRDLRLEELVDVLEGKVLVHAHCYRADEILMLIKVAEDFGFRIKTFQHVLEGYKVASEIAKHGAGASTFSDWWAYKLEAYDAIPYNAAIMAAHGVVVSLNSDSAELSRRLYWEAAKAVKYGGVAEDEALRMVTLNPAIQLGIEKHVGSIEPGKDADFAVFSAHPFSPDARVEMTIIEGVAYFERERDLAARPKAGAAAAAGDAQ